MKIWSIQVIIAIVALLMPMSSAMVGAQDGVGLSISKSSEPTSAAVGDNITYTYTISNSDNFTIENVSLVDDQLGAIDLGGQTSLDAGVTITATATYTVVEADLPGPLVNTATISGTDPDGNPVTDNATATVELTGTAYLQMTKSADKASAAPHQTITYTYTVTNNGDVTINNLALTDDKLGTISLSGSSLAPGESMTATASYTVTTTDLPDPIINTATVTGTGSNGQAISVNSDPVSVSLSTNKWLLFKAEILKLMGVPGKGIDKAPGLQKPFNPKSQAAARVANTDNITPSIGEIPRLKGVKGKGIDTAPGLQKPSNPKSQAVEQAANTDNITQTKAEILKLMGVPGKGIETAPGLQKPFNPNSQAAEHAGKKDKDNEEEQLRIRQSTENHGDTQGQLEIKQKVKNQR